MANHALISAILFALLAATATSQNATGDVIPSLVESQTPAPRLPRPKQTHLRFYWHDIVGGPDPTSIQVASAPSTNSSATSFGLVMMFDNPITLSPDQRSTPVGRSQGFYASASKEDAAFLMTMNVVFTQGSLNGSSLAVVGRNPPGDPVREVPVVGGTGIFRLATGRCILRPHSFNATTSDATVRYDVFVRHY